MTDKQKTTKMTLDERKRRAEAQYLRRMEKGREQKQGVGYLNNSTSVEEREKARRAQSKVVWIDNLYQDMKSIIEMAKNLYQSRGQVSQQDIRKFINLTKQVRKRLNKQSKHLEENIKKIEKASQNLLPLQKQHDIIEKLQQALPLMTESIHSLESMTDKATTLLEEHLPDDQTQSKKREQEKILEEIVKNFSLTQVEVEDKITKSQLHIAEIIMLLERARKREALEREKAKREKSEIKAAREAREAFAQRSKERLKAQERIHKKQKNII